MNLFNQHFKLQSLGLPVYFREDWRLGVLSLKKKIWHKYWFIKDWRYSELCLKIEDYFQNVRIFYLWRPMIEDWLASFEDLTLIFKEIETAPCAGAPIRWNSSVLNTPRLWQPVHGNAPTPLSYKSQSHTFSIFVTLCNAQLHEEIVKIILCLVIVIDISACKLIPTPYSHHGINKVIFTSLNTYKVMLRQDVDIDKSTAILI